MGDKKGEIRMDYPYIVLDTYSDKFYQCKSREDVEGVVLGMITDGTSVEDILICEVSKEIEVTFKVQF